MYIYYREVSYFFKEIDLGKQITFNDEARAKLLEGVDIIADCQ